MDPVNPAPAGNPQLTTHLLVSHKKNKNFHPSKVSLKRVNFINKHVPFQNKIVPEESRLYLHHGKVFGIRGKKVRLTDHLMKDFGQAQWIAYGIADRPYTTQLKLQFDEITKVEILDGDFNYVFKNLVFVLNVLDWDDNEVVVITEKDLLQESLASALSRWMQNLLSSELPSANSMEVEYRWNRIKIKVGDSQTHVLKADQPLKVLTESEDFTTKVFPQLTDKYGDKTMKDMLEDMSLHQMGSHGFQPFQREAIRLSGFLEYVCNKSKATGVLTSGAKILIQEIIQKLVYHIEPFIMLFTNDGTEEPLTHSVLVDEMRDIYRKLVGLQTMDSLDNLIELESCLYWGWCEVLDCLINSQWEFYSIRAEAILNSNDPAHQELLSRLYLNRKAPILDLMREIVLATEVKTKESSPVVPSAYHHLDLTARYQCWVNTNTTEDSEWDHLAVGFTPNQFPEASEFGETWPHKKLSLKDIPKIEPIMVRIISNEYLLVMGSENKFYVCKLRAIINGPSEQTLNQIANCFEVQRNLETIVDIGVTLMNKHMVADLNRDPNQGRFKLKLSLYRFNTQPTSGEAALSVTVKVIEPALDTDGYEIESEMNCYILPKDLVAVGYFGYTSPIEGMPRSSKTLRLKMFKYHHTSNEVSKLTDEVHEIDREFLAQLPELPIYSPLISWDEPRVTFGMHRNRIFCMTSLRSCKPVLQVYCFHRNKFVPIGGTNCNRPGLFVLSRNGQIKFYKHSGFGGLRGYGWTSHIDFKRELIAYKFFEWTLSF